MEQIILYAHGGSQNHGCEAIVRATAKLLKDTEIYLASREPAQDAFYKVDTVAHVYGEKKEPAKFSADFARAYWNLKVKHNYWDMEELYYKRAVPPKRTFRAAMSIGGDNYCYADFQSYISMHNVYREICPKTVLWGCSIEPSLLENRAIRSDLSRYSLITARESITYDALKQVYPNTVLVSDPAFLLETVALPLPDCFAHGNTVGINVSPMVVEKESLPGIIWDNFRALIEYILNHTDMNVALIPHVVWEGGDDRLLLNRLYERYKRTGRIALVHDHNCMELKGFISRCRFFVGARTHATIAAYSSKVPTLAVGYSVKARGIARDLFGTEENFVVPAQSMETGEDLTQAFIWLLEQEYKIRNHLQAVMPEYRKRAEKAESILGKILQECV